MIAQDTYALIECARKTCDEQVPIDVAESEWEKNPYDGELYCRDCAEGLK